MCWRGLGVMMKIEFVDKTTKHKCDHTKVPPIWNGKDPILVSGTMNGGELDIVVLSANVSHLSGKMGTKSRLGRGIMMALKVGKELGLKGEFHGSGLTSLDVVFIDNQEVMIYRRGILVR